MLSHLFTTSALSFLIITITLIHFPTSLRADDGAQYRNCSTPFNCSGFQGLSYPFWGSTRPNYCGHPAFQLNCSGDAPQITTMSMNYRVLKINNELRNLKVVRTDYRNDLCPDQLVNTTINLTTFDYASDSTNLTLNYECPMTSAFLPTVAAGQGALFNCTINNIYLINYYAIDTVATRIKALNLETCKVNIQVPVLLTADQNLQASATNETLVEAIDGGFTLQWDANNTMCDTCLGSGGQCGSISNTTEFACYCSNGTFSNQCGSKSGQKKIPLVIGLAIGGTGIAGLLLGFWIYSCVQRRKKKIAENSKSKDLPTPPSSKGAPVSSTNFSQTTPSFLSSKSDLEKGSTYFGVHVFSYAELEEATANFDPSRELGDGGFGTVYYGKLHDGRVVAVKRLYENNFKRVEQFMNEVEILTRLRHENLVKLYGCTSKRSRELLLVYEYISNGTVADHLNGKLSNSGLLTWSVRLSIAIESADALAYLHKSDVIHRDVKTNNILLDEKFRVKVADFGLSRLFPTDVTHVSTAPQGTPGYVDPEYYQCYQLTDKSDVYSFGVVLIELISSLPAVDTNRHRHDINLANMAINKIQNHTLHELVDPSLEFEKDYTVRRMTTSVAELAFRCLQQERDMRPSMDEVVRILTEIQNEDVGAQKAEVIDIKADDVGLLKNIPLSFSPDSVVTDKWVSSSTAPSSF